MFERVGEKSYVVGIIYPIENKTNPQEDPLNLSILISGGKETNEDFPSNGE